MGHVYASVKFANPRDIEEGRREKMVEERALVDTGATFTTVPRSLAKKLALPIMGSASFLAKLRGTVVKVAPVSTKALSSTIFSRLPSSISLGFANFTLA